jgi:hypothetical protein
MRTLFLGIIVLGMCLVASNAYAVDSLKILEPGYAQELISEGSGEDFLLPGSGKREQIEGIATDLEGNIYNNPHRVYGYPGIIIKTTPNGMVTWFAYGMQDGNGVWPEIIWMVFDLEGNLYAIVKYDSPYTGTIQRLIKISGFKSLSQISPIQNLQTQIDNIELLPGPQGSQGEQGYQGPQGELGPVGPQGIQGNIGPQGIQGEIGLMGLKGDVGLTGDQGEQGAKGDMGPQGLKGDIGATGPRGEKGDIGPIGLTGSKGEQGISGPIGLQGPQGLKGDAGSVGPQGVPGLQGAVGPVGPQGLKGNTGLIGPQGIPGITPREVLDMKLQITSLQHQLNDVIEKLRQLEHKKPRG